MSDWRHFEKYDLALNEWVQNRQASDRSAEDFVYYCQALNEWRLGKYLLTATQLGEFAVGGYALVEHNGDDYTALGEIIGMRTCSEPDKNGLVKPGYWIVLNVGQVEIVQGSYTRKPALINTA